MPRTNVVGTTPPPGSGAQRCVQAGEREHRTDSTTGPATTTSNAIDLRRLAGLCADQVGSDICTAAGIIARSYPPVLALCSRLIQAGYDPATPLQVYRGATLALPMRSLAEAAKLTVEECSDGRLQFRRYRPHPWVNFPARSYTDKNGATQWQALIEFAEAHERRVGNFKSKRSKPSTKRPPSRIAEAVS